MLNGISHLFHTTYWSYLTGRSLILLLNLILALSISCFLSLFLSLSFSHTPSYVSCTLTHNLSLSLTCPCPLHLSPFSVLLSTFLSPCLLPSLSVWVFLLLSMSLTHFYLSLFLSSSMFFTGNQFNSKSSVQMYRIALLSGCR